MSSGTSMNVSKVTSSKYRQYLTATDRCFLGRFFQALSRLPAVLRAWRQIEMAQILLSQFQEHKQACFCQLSGNLLIYSQD